MAEQSELKLTSLRSLRQAGSLVAEVSRRIAADIAAGKLPTGARLPTEQALMEAAGVSRTVVREAVATLRAEGLVITRQGVGAFVAEKPPQRLFQLDPGETRSSADVLDTMELRAAVETEAAGLAAQRADPASLDAIRAACAAIEAAIAAGTPAVREDLAFHLAIADATGNPQFRRFLDFLGGFTIPRASMPIGGNQRAYRTTFQQEHATILAAIEGRSATKARAAMRAHLMRSRERYRDLTTASA